MVTILKMLITNLIGMLMTKHMILWGLKFAAKTTKNLIDDNAVLLIEGAYENEPEKVKKAIEGITIILNKQVN